MVLKPMPRLNQPRENLREAARRAVDNARSQHEVQEQQIRQGLTEQLERQIFTVLGMSASANEDGFAVVDDLAFTVARMSPPNQAPLLYRGFCQDCTQPVFVQVSKLVDLGLALEAEEEGVFLCQACAEARQPISIDGQPLEQPSLPTAADRLLEAMRDYLLEYVIGRKELPHAGSPA